MFFTVKHGAGEESLFNSDCCLKLLVESIKKRCNFPNAIGTSIGFAEVEKFTIVNLSEQSNDMSSCASLFEGRGVYVLLAISKRESGPPKYRPLLENVDAELAAKLDSLSNPKTGAEKLRKGRSFTKNSSTLSSLSKKKSSSSLSKSFSVSSRTKH